MMDREQALREVQASIRNEKYDIAGPMVMEIARNSTTDTMMLLTCASLLRTIGADRELSEVRDMMMAHLPDDPRMRLETAKGLRSMNCPAEAESVLCTLDETDDMLRERAVCAAGTGRLGDALAFIGRISDPDLDDRVLSVEILSGLRRYADAVGSSESVLADFPDDFRAHRCHCSALIMAGRQKDAEKYVRGRMKNDRKSADSAALAAHFMWADGRTAAAGGYASKAVKADPGHIPAMEILAYCLIDNNKIRESKIIAGAINEKDPGNPAAFRILDACSRKV